MLYRMYRLPKMTSMQWTALNSNPTRPVAWEEEGARAKPRLATTKVQEAYKTHLYHK